MNNPPIAVFPPFAPEAAVVTHLFIIGLIVGAVILAVVAAMVGMGLFYYRQQPGSAEAPPFFGNRRLEIFWTMGPALMVICFFVFTAFGLRECVPAPAVNQEPDLIVIGHQGWWEVRYPKAGVVTANEIHLPTGGKWLVRLQSAGGIHDFWVPALAQKIQLIPAQTNHLWLQPRMPGKYAVSYAEFGGVEHAGMQGAVIVESPAAFTTWLRRPAQPAASLAIGPAR